MRNRSKLGWFELLEGILLVVLGVVSFIRPGYALTGVVVIYGLAAVITGISDIIFYVQVDRHTGFGPMLALISGVLSVMVGVMLMAHPNAGKWILSLLLPVWFITHCVSRLAHLNMLRFLAGNTIYYIKLVANICGLVLGFLLLFRPNLSLLSGAYLIGLYLLLLGVESIITGMSRLGTRW